MNFRRGVMPRPGGEADKLGNRYKAHWTVSQLLDFIIGRLTSITVEPLDEARGIEFIAQTSSGTTEFHSVKRQRSAGEWTLYSLCRSDSSGRSILTDLFAKLSNDPMARCHFVSSTGANNLRELSERAQRRSSLEESASSPTVSSKDRCRRLGD